MLTIVLSMSCCYLLNTPIDIRNPFHFYVHYNMQISAVVSNLHVATTPRYLWLEMAGRFVVRNGGKICGKKFPPPRGIVLGFLPRRSFQTRLFSFYLPLMSTYRRMKHVTDRQFDVCPSVSTQTDGCRRRTNEWRKVTYRLVELFYEFPP